MTLLAHLGTLSPNLMRDLSSDGSLYYIHHLLYRILDYLAQLFQITAV